ncbi:hypothetical protein ACFVUS_29070 [Nocardia sp. NPDC058058]|uniref:hypothetical protein n=1 Tax=Nocardia sp. NPDC058058 TaxID=3346317 RepID=UPI0036DF4339
MKQLIVISAITAGLIGSAGSAVAQPVSATEVAVSSQVGAPVAGSSEDAFCAIIRFLKGGWAGRATDCSF